MQRKKHIKIMRYKLSKIVLLFLIGTSQALFAVFGSVFFRSINLFPFPVEEEANPEAQLRQALLTGNTDAVTFLLEAGIDPNEQDQQSWTLAMLIVINRDQLEAIRPGLPLELINLLINSPNFNPNLRNNKGDTVLLLAARCGCEEILECLLDLPNIDVNARGYLGDTVMHLLMINKINLPQFGSWNTAIGKILAHPEWDSNAQNDKGQTVRDLLEIMQNNIATLLEKIDAIQETRLVPLREQELSEIIIAAIGGNEDDVVAIQEYLERYPDLNLNWQQPGTGHTLLMCAVTTGDPNIVRVLLQAPYNYDFSLTDYDGKTVFDHARNNYNEDVINILEEEKAKSSEHISE
ncbi:MAG: ankyrin repeat domain-containing protein [Puniceicoccales bacterium]|jgi:ankyrin repeat protein|nr:ankyrin repeat domain-containing protein [Puniceicoccales bacterium]